MGRVLNGRVLHVEGRCPLAAADAPGEERLKAEISADVRENKARRVADDHQRTARLGWRSAKEHAVAALMRRDGTGRPAEDQKDEEAPEGIPGTG